MYSFSYVDVGIIGRTALKPLIYFYDDLFIYVLEFILLFIKASVVIKNGIKALELKIFGRTKDYVAHKMKIKGISVQGGVEYSLFKM